MQVDASDTSAPDLLLVGGGLANGLLALRLSQVRPDLDMRIVEAAQTLGGVHTWSFFDSDLTQDQRDWIAPLVVHRWPGYSVRFPQFERALSTPYCSVTAERFAAVVEAAMPGKIMLAAPVTSVSPTEAVLADGRRLSAKAVIDGRGPTATPDLALGFQKFVGLEVRLAAPHGLTTPIVMDACVDQAGGYRFLYTLPFDDRTLLIEDTRYTDGDALDREAFRQGVLDYARAQGWEIETILREEDGVLPVALDGDIGSDGSTAQDRANKAGFVGTVSETVAINPALAISGIEILNQWYYRPDYMGIMSNCANTQIGVWSENSLDRSVVVAVYGQPG